MAQPRGEVHIVDDDEAIRHSVRFQLETADLAVQEYISAEAFLDVAGGLKTGCLLTDVRMPGLSGMDLVVRLNEMKFTLPIVMMTGHGDIPLAVEAMKAGVVDFLEKPLDDSRLLLVVNQVLSQPRSSSRHGDLEALRARFDALSPRERDVLVGVAAGKANKVIALDLDISPRTVEVYRAGLMTKTGASSLSELVRMAIALGL